MSDSSGGREQEQGDEQHSLLSAEPIDWKPLGEPILGEPAEVGPILTEPPEEDKDGARQEDAGDDERSREFQGPQKTEDTSDAASGDAASARPRWRLPPLSRWILPQESQALRSIEAPERWARWPLLAAVFLVPTIFDPRTVDAFNLAKMTTLWVLVVGAAATWLALMRQAPSRLAHLRSPLVIAAAVLLGMTVAATVASPNRSLSLFGSYHRYEGLVSVGLYVTLFVLIVLIYRRMPIGMRRELLVAAGAAATLVAAYVVLQSLDADPFRWRGLTGAEPQHPIGNLGNSAFTASYLGVGLPTLSYLVVSSRSRAGQVSWVLCCGLAATALLLTQGRAGIVAALAGIGALVLFASSVPATQKLAGVVVAMLVLAVAPLLSPATIDPPETEARVEHRRSLWLTSARMVVERPLLGWGPESFHGHHPPFRTATEAREQGLTLSDRPHNVFLSWATSAGVAGLLAFAALLGVALWRVVYSPANTSPPVRLLTSAFGAVLVAYMAQGMYSVDVPPLALMAWVALAGIAAMGGSHKDVRGDPDPSPPAGGAQGEGPSVPQRRGVWAAVVVTAALALIIAGLGPLRADHVAWEAERRGGLGFSDPTLQLYESSMRLNPREPAYKALTASYIERVAADPQSPQPAADSYRRAAELYVQALDQQPGNLHFMIGAARAYSFLGELDDERFFAEADQWLGRAVSHDPLDPQVHDLRADLLRIWAAATGDADDASELRRRAAAADEMAQRLRSGQLSP